jgi:predicted ATPase/DNA-binding winged helix-turn-helix (wHTH) protein
MIEPRATSGGAAAISFGPFRLVAAQRLLLEGDKPVRLGSRAFDILTALIERAGEMVGKEELIARVWPATYVDDANLKIQVSALRRALGDGQGDNRYIATVVGRGYNFVAPIREAARPSPDSTSPTFPSSISPSPTIAPAAPHNLPFATTRMIGRDETVTALVARLSSQRLVTIVGTGGIGKTTVALAVAERMLGAFEHGVWLVDLAPLRDPGLVPSAIATLLGLEVRADDPLSGLVTLLRDKRTLLLLDNCEHVIEGVAGLAAAVLSGTSGVSILATSRERLGIIGEREYRLGPLGSPKPASKPTIAETVAFPAVQLFVERVFAIAEDFELTDANAPLVIEICRKLDGLPLAIEFAAPCVEALGVRGLADRLSNSLPLLNAQRRTATARHQTMRAVVDWSYGLLSDDVRPIFRALGIFAGSFTAAAATTVAMDAATTSIGATDLLADLVAKSLVVADIRGDQPEFRLLDTTRTYVIEKLGERGEREAVASRHAGYFRDLFERAEAERETRPIDEWLRDYAPQIDNLRAALDWSFSPGGSSEIGVALTAAAIPLWSHLSLLRECCARTERALNILRSGAVHDAHREMKMSAAFAASSLYTQGPGREVGATWTTVLKLARSLGDTEYQLRALWGLFAFHLGSGEFRLALEMAEKFSEVATTRADTAMTQTNGAMTQAERDDVLIGERIVGVSKHFLGDQTGARGNLEHMLANFVAPASKSHYVVRFGFDQRISARIMLARILWLQGYPEQARRAARATIEEARATDHASSLCYALADAACLIALWTGDLEAADRYIALLVDDSTRLALPAWQPVGQLYQAALLIRRGEISNGLPILRAGFQIGGRPLYAWTRALFQGELAQGLAGAGLVDAALTTAKQTVDRCKRDEEHWLIAELLRLCGEFVMQGNAPDAAAIADDYFREALDWARDQGALSWELRIATSRARLMRQQGRSEHARSQLQPVYDRFTEGFDTADLVAARRLLDELSSADCD